jgi:hypothetical protein
MSSASWAVERYRRHQKAIDEARAVAKERIAETEAWLKRVEHQHEGSMFYLEGLLEAFMRERAAADPKLRTLSLPDADLTLRALPPEIVKDDAALLDYVKEAGLPFVKESLDWAGLKAVSEVTQDGAVILKETGERLPAVIGRQRGDRFQVRFKD